MFSIKKAIKMTTIYQKYWRLYRKDFKETVSLSLPIVGSHVGVVLIGVADNIMVGVLGATELAAVGVANAVFMVLSVLGIGVTSIIAPLVAAAKSRQDYKLTSNLLSNSIYVTFGVSFILMLILLQITYVFETLNQPYGVTQEAKIYLYITAPSLIPMIVFIALKSFCEGLGKMRPPMYILYIIVPINVILNWLLMYGYFGLPALGLAGTAWATFICRFLMLFLIVYYIKNAKSLRKYLTHFTVKNYQKQLSNKLLKLGLPSGFQYVFEAGAFTTSAIIIGWLGENPLAAHQIAISLASITYMMVLGFSVAGGIRIGSANGLKSYTKVFKAGTSVIFLAIISNTFTCLIFIFFNVSLAKIYIDTPEVVTLAASLLIMAGIFQLPDALQAVGLGILRGIEDVNLPTLFTLIAYWVLGIPLGSFLAFYFEMGALGIWVGLTIGLAASATMSLVRFYFLIRKKYKIDKVKNPLFLSSIKV